MSKFFKLIKNEFIKMFKTKSGFVPFAFLAAIIIAGPIISNMVMPKEEKADVDWKTALTAKNEEFEKRFAEAGITKEQLEATGLKEINELAGNSDNPMAIIEIEEYKKNQYHLEHDIAVDTGALGYLSTDLVLIDKLVFLLVIVYASGIVAREYAFGTIKFLLIRSTSRFQIILSKFVTMVLVATMFYTFAAIVTYIVGGFVEGFAPETYRTVQVIDGAFVESSLITDIVRNVGLGIISLLVYVSLVFLISTMMKSVGAAIGVTMFLYLGVGSAIKGFLGKYDWSQYIFFTSTDLPAIYMGHPVVEGMTIGFAIAVQLLYAAVFLAIAIAVFTKRDV